MSGEFKARRCRPRPHHVPGRGVARRNTWRRNTLVCGSGSHTGGRKSAASSRAQDLGVDLVGLTFASAIARVLTGLDTTT
jgi:hypothetical protein